MPHLKGPAFNCSKYILIASYVLSCIGCFFYIIGGVLMVTVANTEVKGDQQITDSEREIIKISGYVLITAALIAIPISVLGIYAVYKENYKLNVWMAAFAVIGLFFTLFSQTRIMVIVIQAILTGCQLYFTLRLKQNQNYSIDDNNPESGKVKPNESTAIVMNAYQE